MTVTIFGRRVQLVWLAFWAFFSMWFFWKGILLFSIVAFAPAVFLEYRLKKAGCGPVLRILIFVPVALLSAGLFNQIRAYF